MDDVRGQLHRHLANHIGGFCVDAMDWGQVADTILERFDVTPKPVLTPEAMAELLANVFPSVAFNHQAAGKEMLSQLAAAGLELVRCDE